MLFKDHFKLLDKSQRSFINKGFLIFDIEDLILLENIKQRFIKFIEKKFKIKTDDLHSLHSNLTEKKVNEVRLSFYNFINLKNTFVDEYLRLGAQGISSLVGSELAGNKNVNFSIQMPDDSSSSLGIHSDSYSGESDFQVNLWVPLTNAKKTNSMFVFNPKFSKKINSSLKKYEQIGIDNLLKKNKKEYTFLEVPYGKGVLFTPTCLHGNIVNRTKETRISFNCRYKNFFSPYSKSKENNRNLGSFYKPLTLKPATIIGFNSKLSNS